jgi:hypothetical protein
MRAPPRRARHFGISATRIREITRGEDANRVFRGRLNASSCPDSGSRTLLRAQSGGRRVHLHARYEVPGSRLAVTRREAMIARGQMVCDEFAVPAFHPRRD